MDYTRPTRAASWAELGGPKHGIRYLYIFSEPSISLYCFFHQSFQVFTSRTLLNKSHQPQIHPQSRISLHSSICLQEARQEAARQEAARQGKKL